MKEGVDEMRVVDLDGQFDKDISVFKTRLLKTMERKKLVFRSFQR